MTAEMKVHPIVYFLFKSMVRLALVLIFVGIPAAVYYQRVHGIGFGAKEALGKALSTPTIDPTHSICHQPNNNVSNKFLFLPTAHCNR